MFTLFMSIFVSISAIVLHVIIWLILMSEMKNKKIFKWTLFIPLLPLLILYVQIIIKIPEAIKEIKATWNKE